MRKPGWIAVVGTVLALAMVATCLALTRTTEWVERHRDPAMLESAAEDLQVELDRLHARFVDRLDLLAAEVWRARNNTFGPERTAAGILGVRTITVLPLREEDERIHLEIREQNGAFVPFEPAFDEERFPVLSFKMEEGEKERLVDRGEVEQTGAQSGWLRAPSNVFYYWKRQGAAGFLLIGVDGAVVREAISEWLRSKEEFPLVGGQSAMGEFTRLVGADGTTIFESGEDPGQERPPRLFPASIRFGTWQLQSWNAAEERIVWNVPYLWAGLGLAGLVFAGSLASAVALQKETRLARQRVSFVNRASHELRTPITNLMLNVDLARDMVEEEPAAAELRLDRVSDEASRLSRLVDNLLTFSRSENGTDQIHLSPTNPDQILDEVLEQFEMSLRDRNIGIVRGDRSHAEISADPDALAQVFGNLISNAEKYASCGGYLELVSKVENGSWIGEFRDHGPGVSPRQATRIFEPFHRVRDGVAEGASGTGLGLTIARDLTQRMKGDLKLVPTEKGATFRIELPLRPA